jgi:filamentous hemagglutinin family protein
MMSTKGGIKHIFIKQIITAKIKKTLILVFSMTAVSVVCANPVLDNVAVGQASVTQAPNTTTINQTSPQAIINWDSFNIAAGEKTQFIQPNASAIALNRINPAQGASQIYGSLSANGQIILINAAGVHFGPNSMVNVGSLIASTSDISNANFLAGNYKFDIPSPFNASILNEGTIVAANHGLIALLGFSVQNNGLIQAELGNIILGSGNKFTLDFYGDQLINFSVDEGVAAAGSHITNNGNLLADGGKILVTAKTAQGVLDSAINMAGVAQAQSVDEQNGEIILSSDNNINVTGTLDASGISADATGGTIKVLGDYIHLASTANLNASGDAGGGEILVGGNFHGAGPEQNALTTTIDSGAFLNANAMTRGNGGRIAVWSNNDTNFHGNIFAKAGRLSGNGGYVETSGENLDVAGSTVNTLAPMGQIGMWLLDPLDVTIGNNSTANDALSGGTYTPTTTGAYINVSQLNTALNSSNITITTGATGSTGSDNGDITVSGTSDSGGAAAISWSGAHALTLSAYRNINIDDGASFTATFGSLTLQANNSGYFTYADYSGSSGGGKVTSNSSDNGYTQGNYTLNVTGGVNIFFNPISYTSPATFTNNSGSTTAYMLINALGTATDDDFSSGSSSNLTLGALSNPNNASDNILYYNYALSKDIDASSTLNWNSGAGFSPIGNYASGNNFGGNFNGQGHTIDKLYMNLVDNTPGTVLTAGLFGYISLNYLSYTDPIIQNIGLTNLNISAGASNGSTSIGGLVGYMDDGTIQNAYTTGSVTALYGQGGDANTATGGLAGNFSYSQLSNSFNTATVTGAAGASNAGGLIGQATSTTIANVYNTGNVIGGLTESVGGLIGVASGSSISQAYNIGKVSLWVGGVPTLQTGFGLVSTNSSFWSHAYYDTQTSGQTSSHAGTKVNTSALQGTLPTGFSSNIWGIQTGSYPYLKSIYTTAPSVISGFAPNNTTGTTVQLATGTSSVAALSNTGTTVGSTTSYANGYYYFFEPNGIVPSGNIILTSATNANAIDIYPSSGSISGLNLTTNTINIGGTNTSPTISNTTLANAYLNGTSLYSVSSSNITLNNGINLNTTSSTPYSLNDTLNTTGSGTITFGGSLTLGSASTINSAGGLVDFQGAVNASGQTLTLNSAGSSTGTMQFDNSVTLDGLIASSQAYNVSLLGTTTAITSLTNFLNTGTLTLGKSDGSSTLTFAGGLTATASSALTTYGTINTNGNAIHLGAITLGSATTLATNNTVAAGAGLTIGAVTSAAHALTLNAGTGGAITGSSFAGNGNLIITNSGSTTFSGAVNAGTVTLTNTTGNIIFNGALTASTLNTAAQGYGLQLNSDSTITNAATFSNTGGVTLVGTNLFSGGLTSTASTTTLNGNARTAGNALTFGSLALTGNSTIDTTNNGGSVGGAALGLGAVTGNFNLTLNSGNATGTNNTITGTSITNTGNNLTIANSHGTTFSGAVNLGTGTATLTNTTGTIAFGGLTAATLTTANQAYGLTLNGNGTITNATAFLNTGTLNLGNGGTFAFTNGLTTTGSASNPSTVNINGTINTTNNGMTLGAITLGGTSTLTSSAGNLSLAGITSGGNALTLNTGTTGTINGSTFSGNGNLTITNSGGTTFSGAVNAGTVTLTNTTGSIAFNGGLTAATLTTANQAYGLTLNGNGTITNATAFLNTGTLNLGNGGTLAFTNGLTTTGSASNPSTVNINGAINTTNNGMTLGAITLGGDSILTSATGNISLLNGVNSSGKNLTLTGNTNDNIFTLVGNLNVNNLNINGSSNGNNTLNVRGNSNETWAITGANSGSITGTNAAQFNFNHIGNLGGSNNNDTFALNGGTLTGSITGGTGNNTLLAGNVNNIFNINSQNSGSVTGIANFSNIKNLTGGSNTNTFNFANNAGIDGILNAGGSATNTLNYAQYSPLTVTMTSDHGGTAQNIGGGFQNVNNLTGSGTDTLTIANGSKTNVITITDALQGYVNDPTNFSGFNTFISNPGVNTQVVFNAYGNYNANTNSAVVNGSTLYFSNIQSFSGNMNTPPVATPPPASTPQPTAAQTTAAQSAAITSTTVATPTTTSVAPVTSSSSTPVIAGSMNEAALQNSMQSAIVVNNTITTISDSQAAGDLQVTNDEKVSTNCS